MKNSLMYLIITLLVVGASGTLIAEQDNPYGIEWDAAAVASMSKVDRMAYQKQYKRAVEAAALAAGTEFVVPDVNRSVVPKVRVPGSSITYHSGSLSASPVSSFCVGNRFDTALGTMGGLAPVEMSGSITGVTANLATASGNAFVSFYDQLNGTTANQIDSFSTGPFVTGLNTITFATARNYVGTSFLGGIWNFGADVVNVATGTVLGQGFHGMSINDGNPGNGYNAYTMTNGAFGVGGNVSTPVELMNFEIE